MIKKNFNYITNLANIDASKIDMVGLKSYYLSILTRENIPVGTGFVLDTSAFDTFLSNNSLISKISEIIETLDTQNSKSVTNASDQIKKLIRAAEMPLEIKKEIIEAYKNISTFSDTFVDLIPSPLNEQLDESNYTHDTTKFSDIKSEEHIIEHIKDIWMSLFDKEAILFREKIQYSGDLSIAVIIKKAVQCEASGKAFNFLQLTNDSDFIEVNAIYGFDDEEVRLKLVHDTYKVDKQNIEITEKDIFTQEWMFVRNPRGKEKSKQKIEISRVWRQKQKIDDHTIKSISKAVKIIEDIFVNKKIELVWGKEADKIHIMDMNFIRDLNIHENLEHISKDKIDIEFVENKQPNDKDESKKLIPQFTMSHFDLEKKVENTKKSLKGNGNMKGEVWGVVKIVNEFDDLSDISAKSILVISESIEIVSSDLNLLTFKGIIFENAVQIQTDHPCIVDVVRATSVLRENELITINSDTGEVLLGNNIPAETSEKVKIPLIVEPAQMTYQQVKVLVPEFNRIITTTDTFISVDNESLVFPKSMDNIDGILVTNLLNTKTIAQQVLPKPVIYRVNFDLENTQQFTDEMTKIRDYRNKENLRNISISIKNLKRQEDFIEAKKYLNSLKIRRSSSFKIYIHINSSSSVLSIDELLKEDMDGLILDLDELVVDMFKDNRKKLYEETALIKSIELVAKSSIKYKQKLIIKTKYFEKMIDRLGNHGIFGICVEPIAIKELKEIMSAKEVTLLTKKVTKKN